MGSLHTSSILSTHSGHHRIFIGPVVQKKHHPSTNNNNTSNTRPNGPSSLSGPLKRPFAHQSPSSQAPKPWWDQQNFLRSHLSLHGTNQNTTPSNNNHSGNNATHNITTTTTTTTTTVTTTTTTTTAATIAATDPEFRHLKQSSIPTFSYVVSDQDSDHDHSMTEDEGLATQDSDGDELDDRDISHDEAYDIDVSTHPYRHSGSTTCSSESYSARVGQSPSRQQQQNDRWSSANNDNTRGERKGKGKEKAVNTDDDDDDKSDRIGLNLWGSKENKRTKSMRDEGEQSRFKRFFGGHKKRPRPGATLFDDPDLGWHSDSAPRHGLTRQPTSGALTVNNHQELVPHHTILVGSPLSSEVDLPSTNLHNGRPVFVSSPTSSLLDVSTDDDKGKNLERPEPSPLQSAPSESDDDEGGKGRDRDHLGPGVWKPSYYGTSNLSPMNSKLQHGATWMTARESPSNTGLGSLQDQTIEEGDETDEEDSEEHYTLAKVFSQDSSAQGAGVGSGSVTSKQKAVTAVASPASSGNKTPDKGAVPSPDKAVKDLTAVERRRSPSNDSKDSEESKGSLKRTLTKASTRFGRALLGRAPTALNRRSDIHVRIEERAPTDTFCSLDKDCQLPFRSDTHNNNDGDNGKKHVRFLTKVQYQISPSRRSTLLALNPVVKQDRMLVRKEVTERPGPHVFNAETARKMERRSLGWREWWCVLKGPPPEKAPVNKVKRKKSAKASWKELGRLELYYNHKKIETSVILTSRTSVSVYSSLDYSIAVTQNYRDEIGLTIYIIRPRTISLACAWYMEIYTLLHGSAPIPSFIELGVPDFDVKIRVPIPDDPDSDEDDDDDDDYTTDEGDDGESGGNDANNNNNNDNGGERDETALSSALPLHGPAGEPNTNSVSTSLPRFKTALTDLPQRMASKSFYLVNDNSKQTLVAPNEVTPKLLRSHALALLKQVPDWTEVVSLWKDPKQHGDVALCWKRYDRIEWIYWSERIFAETENVHLRKDHIGFADGSDWAGGMDETVVGPQVLDKTHKLELRPITHYPTKVSIIGNNDNVETLHEPDPIEGYIVRISTFSGNPLRRFRRLYLTSHDHMLIYTVPTLSHSPEMQNAGLIDPEALVFCITPHKSADPDHKDMAQSRSVRRLKAQVRAAQGFIDMTKIGSVRVLKVKEWNEAKQLMFKKNKGRQGRGKESKVEKLGKAVKHLEEDVVEAMKLRHHQQQQEQPEIVVGEADNYFFPTETSNPIESHETQGSSSQQHDQHQEHDHQQQRHIQIQEARKDHETDLHASEPLCNKLGTSSTIGDTENNDPQDSSKGGFKNALHNTATFVADALHLSRHDNDSSDDDSNVIEIEMEDGKSCVRFRAYNAEAARLWRDQLEKLAKYWRHRKRQDVRDHMAVQQANSLQLSSEDDDEGYATIGGGGITVHDWDNDRAVVSPEIWNWCVVNGCRSITKSGFIYFKPNIFKTFRKMFLVLTEGFLMLFHPHRRSKVTGKVIPSTACKLSGIFSLKDIYIYSGHFSDEDTNHGTNDESEHLARYFPDGLIVDDPDEDCTFSIWRGKRQKMFSRRSSALMSMSSRPLKGSSRLFGKNGVLSCMVKDGVVYGVPARHCSVVRARSRPDLEEWVYAINTEIERIVRAERRRIHYTGRM
ncbi:hypothetical protein BGX20_008612 [Mortierella sp. AD010]|nr:hypothetical protein BGX20_008612 [Mortierella sp. AD010]